MDTVSIDVAEKEAVYLFTKKHELEVQKAILIHKMDSCQKDLLKIEENIKRANLITEIYREVPIKIVNLRRGHEWNINDDDFFVRVFPVFRNLMKEKYSANIYRLVGGGDCGMMIFHQNLLDGLCLPFNYQQAEALRIAKDWVTIHILPEKEASFVREKKNAFEQAGSESPREADKEEDKVHDIASLGVHIRRPSRGQE